MKLALAALSAAALASSSSAQAPAHDEFVPTALHAPLLEQFTDSSVPSLSLAGADLAAASSAAVGLLSASC